MKLALEELSAQKNFWLLFRAEKQLSGRKDGSKVLLALAMQRRKGRPYSHPQVRRPSPWKVCDVASISAGEQNSVSKR